MIFFGLFTTNLQFDFRYYIKIWQNHPIFYCEVRPTCTIGLFLHWVFLIMVSGKIFHKMQEY